MVPLQIVLRTVRGDRDVDVVLRNPDATLGDVLRGVPGEHPTTLWVDGRPAPVDRQIADSGLHEGSVLATVAGARDDELDDPELSVLTGTRAGARIPIRIGLLTVGRLGGNRLELPDRGVSGHHCELWLDHDGEVTVTDVGSRFGTAVDGGRLPARTPVALADGATLEIGDVVVRFHRRGRHDRPRLDLHRSAGEGGTVPFNRPPRPAPPPPCNRWRRKCTCIRTPTATTCAALWPKNYTLRRKCWSSATAPTT